MRPHRLQDGAFLIVDDHALLREGVASVLRTLCLEGNRIEQADHLAQAIARLSAEGGKGWTVVLDLHLPDSAGLSTLEAIREASPLARIAIVSAHHDLDLAIQCIQAGACAFVPKHGSLVEFQQALAVIASGGVYFPKELFVSAGVAATETKQNAPAAELTPRQLEVLRGLLDGLSNAAIAKHLQISEETVKLHVRAILRAHGAANRVQLLLGFARQAA